MNTFKVVELGLDERVIELYAKGLGSKSIAKVFNQEGIDISHMAIERWTKSVETWTKRLMDAEHEVRRDYAKKFLNTLDLIYEEMKELQTKSKQYGSLEDRDNYIKIKRLLKDYVELNAKRLGDLKNFATTIKADKVEVNMNVAVKNEILNFVSENFDLDKEKDIIYSNKPEMVDIVKARDKKLAADIGQK